MRELYHPDRLPRVSQCYPHSPCTCHNASTVQVVQHPSKSHSDTPSQDHGLPDTLAMSVETWTGACLPAATMSSSL